MMSEIIASSVAVAASSPLSRSCSRSRDQTQYSMLCGSACDENVYHEALAHPVFLAHGNPETVLSCDGVAMLQEVNRILFWNKIWF